MTKGPRAHGGAYGAVDRVKGAGTLARLSSNPSLLPYLRLDIAGAAERVREEVGGVFGPEQLLGGLERGSAAASPQNVQERPAAADLHVGSAFGVAGGPAERGGGTVLTIRPEEREGERQYGTAFLRDAGFAVGVPVTPREEPVAPPSAWEFLGPCSPMAHRGRLFDDGGEFDEEHPLLGAPEASGLNMSYVRTGVPPAFVQRFGPRDVAERQELKFAVGKSGMSGEKEACGARTGLLLPILDSRDDLRQVLFIVPGEGEGGSEGFADVPPLGLQKHGAIASAASPLATAAASRLANITAKIPPMMAVGSTVNVHGTAQNATVSVSVKKNVSGVGYIILLIALLSLASQGTVVKWLPASIDGMLIASWRMQAQTVLTLPLFIFQVCTMNSKEREKLSDPLTLRLIANASIAQLIWTSGFFLAIDYTTLFHAWSLSNVHALPMVLLGMASAALQQGPGGAAPAKTISEAEFIGALIAVCGVLFMQIPAVLAGDLRRIIGDLIAIAGSMGALQFLNICAQLRNRVPLFAMMVPMSALNSVMFYIVSAVLNGTVFSMTEHGAFGWLSRDYVAFGLYLGGVVGLLGTISCIAALKFLPSVIVGSVQTMMPVVGTIIAIFVGVARVPDIWTTLGGATLLWGVLRVADATRSSEHTVVINDNISEPA